MVSSTNCTPTSPGNTAPMLWPMPLCFPCIAHHIRFCLPSQLWNKWTSGEKNLQLTTVPEANGWHVTDSTSLSLLFLLSFFWMTDDSPHFSFCFHVSLTPTSKTTKSAISDPTELPHPRPAFQDANPHLDHQRQVKDITHIYYFYVERPALLWPMATSDSYSY